MKRWLIALALVVLSTAAAATQTSTVNPLVPTANSPLTSAPVRSNFTAAYNDINNLYTLVGNGAATPVGPFGSIQYNNNGVLGPYLLGNNLSTSVSGGQTYLNSTATGSAAALFVTTSNQSFYLPLSSAATSPGLTSLYSSSLVFNPSSGLLAALGVTTSSLIDNGNASLTGTTTLATAQIGAGNAALTNLSATTVTGTTGNFPTLNFTNALGTTITATTIKGTNAALSGTLTAANTNVTGTAAENNAIITTLTVGTCNGCSGTTLSNTTSNATYYLGFTTSTSGTLNTLYGTAADLFFNASTGVLSALGVTTTTLTGVNATLSGTTTANALNVTGTENVATSNITTLNFTNALGTTITSTNYKGTSEALSGTITAGALVLTSTALGVSSGGTGDTTLTQYGVLLGNGASAITALGPTTTPGWQLTSTATAPVWGAPTSSIPSQTGHAFQYLSTNGSTPNWLNPASLVDPRTYGASCVGPGYTGGLTSGGQGILITAGGTSYTTGTYTAVPLTGGAGSGAQATIIVSGGAVTNVTITTAASGTTLFGTAAITTGKTAVLYFNCTGVNTWDVYINASA